MNIANRLNYMRGKYWLYQTREYKVIDTAIYDDIVVISTDKEMIKFNGEEAPKKLSDFTELKGRRPEQEEKKGQAIELYRHDEVNTLFDTLIANIKNVKDNKEYVFQANAINKSVQQIAQLLRMEVEIKKLELKKDGL